VSDTGDPSSKPRAPEGLWAQWRLIRRMLGFVAPVKFQVAVVVVLLIANIGVEVWAVKLLAPPVNILKKLATGEHVHTNVWQWTSQEFHGAARANLTLWDWVTAPSGSGADLRHAIVMLALARLILIVLSWARSVGTSWQNMSMLYYMRAAVYDRLQRVGFAFHDRHSSGALINRALSDLGNVRGFVQTGLLSSVDLTFSMVGYFGILISTSPLLAATVALPLPLWIWALRRFAIQARPIYERQMAASDQMVNVLTENAAGVHVVRAFATEDLEEARFGKTCGTLLDRILDSVRLRQRMVPLLHGIFVATHVTLFALGAIFVQQGTLQLGDLVVFGTAMGAILGKLHQINAIADSYQAAVVSSGRLFEILDSPDTTPEIEKAPPLGPGGGSVHLHHVTFGYAPERLVLKDIHFTVPAGSVVALVGPTGSGKTTLAALVGRFYDPQEGWVKIDGQNIRKRSLKSVRDSVGYVFQDTYLFSDTVARNIAYSDLDAPRKQIEEAARLAQADEFVQQLPEKYDTSIGEYGATLSGGQRQRLAIARAILHNPRVLILDDSLSAVDPETESRIRRGLERVMAHRTVFIITSRVSTARRATHILVLEDGRITQRGTHDELIKQPGYYREMAASQFTEGGRGYEASHMDRMREARALARLARAAVEEDREGVL